MSDPQPLQDYPGLDGTCFAHPAWWRGHDQGCAETMRQVIEILDAPPGTPLAGVSIEPWESLRKRLAALRDCTAITVTDEDVVAAVEAWNGAAPGYGDMRAALECFAARKRGGA